MTRKDTKMLRVMCPYCTVGSALVEIVRRHGADTVDKTPRPCRSCSRYFDLQITMSVSGIPLQTVDRDKAFRKSLKELVGF